MGIWIRSSFFVAALIGAVSTPGCDTKSTQAPPAPAPVAAVPVAPPASAEIGIAVCDEYLKKKNACLTDWVPQNASERAIRTGQEKALVEERVRLKARATESADNATTECRAKAKVLDTDLACAWRKAAEAPPVIAPPSAATGKTLSADELFAAVTKDETFCDAGTVRVKGKVVEVLPGAGTSSFSLEGEHGASCFIRSEFDKQVAALKKGATVTVECMCVGVDKHKAMLVNCVLK